MNYCVGPIELWLECREPGVSKYNVFISDVRDKEAHVSADSFGLYV